MMYEAWGTADSIDHHIPRWREGGEQSCSRSSTEGRVTWTSRRRKRKKDKWVLPRSLLSPTLCVALSRMTTPATNCLPVPAVFVPLGEIWKLANSESVVAPFCQARPINTFLSILKGNVSRRKGAERMTHCLQDWISFTKQESEGGLRTPSWQQPSNRDRWRQESLTNRWNQRERENNNKETRNSSVPQQLNMPMICREGSWPKKNSVKSMLASHTKIVETLGCTYP